jgi:hypothetical protein
MFNPYLIEENLARLTSPRPNLEIYAVVAAQKLCEEAYWRGRLGKIWSALTRRSRRLLHLAAVQSAYTIAGRHEVGMQTVPLQQIQGSDNEGRSNDFDLNFYPLQAHDEGRWKNVATAWYLGKVLPPVELIQVGDVYFVRDGHHRISVARALGQQDIDARVTVWEIVAAAGAEQAAAHGLVCQPV